MKVPNLSLEHNIFSGNPLILEGSELEDYIVYNLGNKDKSIKFLNKVDDLVSKKKMGNFIVSAQEMENLERIRNNEKSKGYLPPEVEISKLKNDITCTRNSCKNLDGFDSFFEALNKRKKIIEKFSRLKNKSTGNLFNNINNNNIINSNNNLDSINNSINNSNCNPKNQRKYSFYSKYKNLALNNSDITSTTGINITRKQSSAESFRDFNFRSNVSSSMSRQHKSRKIRLSPLSSPFLFSAKNKESNRKNILDKKISDENNLKLALKNSFRFNSPKDKISPIIKKLHIPKIKEISKLNLHKVNKKENISILSEEDKNLTHDSEIDELFQINKEIENINKNDESKNDQNIKDKDKNINLDNGTEEIKINIKEEEKEQNKIEIKEEENEKEKVDKINEVENLFEIAKRKGFNLKENKKEIENFAISKGKELKDLLSKKNTYFSIFKLKQKELERNLILEEIMIRNGNNTKLPFTQKEKIFLEKNKSFLDGIINHEKKFKEIIIENKFH